MSNRERWIVYPLLLFTIVSIVFDRIGDRSFVHFDRIQCGELIVASPHGAPRIVLRQMPETSSGSITVHGPAVRTKGHARINLNEVQTEVGANDAGGFVRISGADGVPALVLGHVGEQQSSGLVATDQHGVLLAAIAEGHETPATWGPTLSWEHVPNSQRDFEQAQATLRSGEDANGAATEVPESAPPEGQRSE